MVGDPKISERHYVETGNEPEYFVTDLKFETAGGGNVRIYCYSLRHADELHLLFTAVVPAQSLIHMGREAMQAGSDAFNLDMWREKGEGH